MLYRDIVDLIVVEEIQNDNGFNQEQETSRNTVFANKKSVRGSEFYQANQQGIKLDMMIEVKTVDYNQEKMLEFDGLRYNIIRTYDKNNEITELICSAIRS